MDIHIPDPQSLDRKKEAFKESGASRLHVVSDWDRTLTKAFVDGQKTHTSIAQIREGGYLMSDYAPKAFGLFDRYHPIEIDPTIPQEEKNKNMVAWWSTHIKLLVECGMHKDIVGDIIKKSPMHAREGTFALLDILAKHKIPLLIFSAGLGDIIEGYLKSSAQMHQNIHIISNFFAFDKDGKATGYKSGIIHTFNKSEVSIKDFPYQQEIEARRNVLLIGDSLGDVGMGDGIDHDNIIKIGFLNKPIDRLMDEYSRVYDVIILNDGPMDYVTGLVRSFVGNG